MISPQLIEKEITSQNLKQVQIITIAMNLGVSLFAFVCIFLYLNGTENSIPDNELINLLLIALFVISVSSYILSIYIPRKILMGTISKQGANFVSAFNSYQILKLGLLEAPALFGLVIIIIGITSGIIYQNEYIFIALFPLIIMIAFSVLIFPTELKVKTLFRSIHEETQLK